MSSLCLSRLRKNAGPGVAPGFSPGKRVFNPLKHCAIKFGALALVGTSEAVCDFFRSLLVLRRELQVETPGTSAYR
jgi:hypothetical protein